MSLIGALNIGKSALATHQAAIQVTGNNISNAGNADYTRQVAQTAPAKDRMLRPGVFLGTGIDLTAVRRQIDEALEGRLRGSVSDNEAGGVVQQWLGRLEAVFNELTDDDLSTQLSTFFNSWSNLANKPQDTALRQVVIQNGQSVAKWFQDMRGQVSLLRSDVDDRLRALSGDANQLAQRIADINGQIVIAEGGAQGEANGLRDQRDTLLKQLSQLIDIQTMPQANGTINVYVGSEPLIIGTQNRGVSLRQETVDGQVVTAVTFAANNGAMQLKSGQVGGLGEVRKQIVDVLDTLDSLAGSLIFELNKVHAAGQGLEGFASVSATNPVDDATLALNHSRSGLKFPPTNGSFVVHVTNRASGLVESTLVQVDLDGLNGDDTTLASLAAELDGVANMNASVSGGILHLAADSGDVEISFSQDSSGVLASLGINSFFTGRNARDIAVNGRIVKQPSLLAAAKNGEKADNQTARAIAELETRALASLGGASLKASYESAVNVLASSAASSRTNAEAARIVQETLQAQREALSGVSLDEEAVNLMREQRAFQGAARLITAVNEMMETVLGLVR